mmetsp:Transcript_51129/g.122435  ORF Transcript_51129/g.122435 Transcript_51129/m.122435 type:complete len:265 (+) Transcript_51129:117-911(+)
MPHVTARSLAMFSVHEHGACALRALRACGRELCLGLGDLPSAGASAIFHPAWAQPYGNVTIDVNVTTKPEAGWIGRHDRCLVHRSDSEVVVTLHHVQNTGATELLGVAVEDRTKILIDLETIREKRLAQVGARRTRNTLDRLSLFQHSQCKWLALVAILLEPEANGLCQLIDLPTPHGQGASRFDLCQVDDARVIWLFCRVVKDPTPLVRQVQVRDIILHLHHLIHLEDCSSNQVFASSRAVDVRLISNPDAVRSLRGHLVKIS